MVGEPIEGGEPVDGDEGSAGFFLRSNKICTVVFISKRGTPAKVSFCACLTRLVSSFRVTCSFLVFFFFFLPGVFLWVFLQLQPTTGAEYGRPFKEQG